MKSIQLVLIWVNSHFHAPLIRYFHNDCTHAKDRQKHKNISIGSSMNIISIGKCDTGIDVSALAEEMN